MKSMLHYRAVDVSQRFRADAFLSQNSHLHAKARLLGALLVFASWVSHVHHAGQPDSEKERNVWV